MPILSSITVDAWSMVTTPLDLMRGDLVLAKGSGFFWRNTKGEVLLGSCWHNFTGVDPVTGVALSHHGGRPTAVKFWAPTPGNGNNRLIIERPLYDEEGNALWLVHPSLRQNADVVALPVGPVPEFLHYVNEVDNFPLRRVVGMDVFVLGYPEGISRDWCPVWKRGSLALEPQMVCDEEPFTLIDTATRAGMSGALVVQRAIGFALHEGSDNVSPRTTATRFFGVYSGRFATKDEFGAHLGIVWPSDLFERIAEDGVRDAFFA